MDSCVFEGILLTKVLPPLLVLEFVFGVLGNGLALWIFCCHIKPWRSSTVFLFNLALADFLLNISLPFRVRYYLAGMDWTLGDSFCRASLFMLAMNRGGCVFFLTVIAVDRYFRVVHPNHPLNSMTVTKSFILAGMLWLATIALNIHLLLGSNLFEDGDTTRCEGFTQKNNLHCVVFFLEFLISLGIILFCTTRTYAQFHQRHMSGQPRIRRVMMCLTAVTVMFIVCFLPSNVTRVLIWVKDARSIADCQGNQILQTSFHITISLTYLNSMLDPVVYYFSSPSFKKICKNVVKLEHKQHREQAKETST
ncbi:hydroxycarboxylic acid receptor 2-like [Chanos chanos]|uniref:Hydroxycarboxylic acid receptor 2-like n=1 Tax=Chanos chanos TaxID=29144 RepID=A0A6J2X1R2_CHACN|nr:hydroxycarboxylic acid receptor 2-like [Chanos chanos]